MKKSVTITLILIIILVISCRPEQKGVNLLKNPGFEMGTGEVIAEWTPNHWAQDATRIITKQNSGAAKEGNLFATIIANTPSDAKLSQWVAVKPRTIYKLSGYIQAAGIQEGTAGASLSVLGPYASTPFLYDTGGAWEYVEMYGRTGPGQTSLEVAVRLGNYSSLNQGTASFDRVEFSKISNIPPGKTVVKFYRENVAPQTVEEKQPEGDVNVFRSIPVITIFSVLYIFLFIVIYRYLITGKELAKVTSRQWLLWFGILLGVGLIARLIVAPLIKGLGIDVGLFNYWITEAGNKPLYKYFDPPPGNFDYPPGIVYIFAIIANIRNLFMIQSQSGAALLLMKLPSILADILTAYVIYRVGKKRVKEATAVGVAVLYLFNPCVFLNSAIWGQVDSVSALLVLLSLIFIMRSGAGITQQDRADELAADREPSQSKIRKFFAWIGQYNLMLGSMIFVAAVLIKWQSGFLILALFYALIQKKSLKSWLTSIGGGLVTLVLLILPFNIGKPPFWLVEKFVGAMGGYKYATINMFNVYSLMKGNWTPLTDKFWGIPFSTWGIIFAALAFGLSTFLYFKTKKESKYYLASLVFIAMVVLMYVVMHERYLYPVMILALVSVIYTKDKRLLFIFLGFSLTSFFNVAYIMDRLNLGGNYQYINKVTDPVMLTAAVTNMLLMLYLIKVAINQYVCEKFLSPAMFRK